MIVFCRKMWLSLMWFKSYLRWNGHLDPQQAPCLQKNPPLQCFCHFSRTQLKGDMLHLSLERLLRLLLMFCRVEHRQASLLPDLLVLDLKMPKTCFVKNSDKNECLTWSSSRPLFTEENSYLRRDENFGPLQVPYFQNNPAFQFYAHSVRIDLKEGTQYRFLGKSIHLLLVIYRAAYQQV